LNVFVLSIVSVSNYTIPYLFVALLDCNIYIIMDIFTLLEYSINVNITFNRDIQS